MSAQAQFERLLVAGFRLPFGVDPADALEAWCAAFERTDHAQLERGIGWLIRHEPDRDWPLVSSVWDAIRAATAGESQPASTGCPTCHGSTWVDAPPYRANGGLVYRGVVRCSACGVPAPRLDHLRGQHSPLPAAELREWAQAQSREGGPRTREEFAAAVAAVAARVRARARQVSRPVPVERQYREDA